MLPPMIIASNEYGKISLALSLVIPRRGSALPLLGITRLKAKEILPYSLLAMIIGGSIYIVGILLF